MHTEQTTQFGKIPLILLLDTLVGFFFGLCLMLIAAVLISWEWLPESFVETAAVISGAMSCALSAYLSGKMLGRGLLYGAIHGTLQCFVSYLMGLLVFLRLTPSVWSLKLPLCCVIGGIIGGILSATRLRFKTY